MLLPAKPQVKGRVYDRYVVTQLKTDIAIIICFSETIAALVNTSSSRERALNVNYQQTSKIDRIVIFFLCLFTYIV